MAWAKKTRAEVAAYLADLIAVGRQHGFSLSHEDGHGSFQVHRQNEGDEQWLLEANDETQEDG